MLGVFQRSFAIKTNTACQVELRAWGHEDGSYENWKLLILLADLGDQKVMVAVDDFVFRQDLI